MSRITQVLEDLIKPRAPGFSSLDPQAQNNFKAFCREVCAEINKECANKFVEAFYVLYPVFLEIADAEVHNQKGLAWAVEEAKRSAESKATVREGVLSEAEIYGIMIAIRSRAAHSRW